MLNPTIFSDHEEMSAAAANWLAARLGSQPDALLALATGATPLRAYQLLAQRPIELFEHARILKLDEWGGIPMTSPATCETFLRSVLIGPLGLRERYVGFESGTVDPVAECARIAEWLEANGPIDNCVLGLGVNGHLGFNEPADALQPHAHIAALSQQSLTHSMVRNLRQPPTHGLTLGMADILHARDILLVVSGPTKAAALKQLLAGKITTRFPASFLWTHPRVTILCDQAAAG